MHATSTDPICPPLQIKPQYSGGSTVHSAQMEVLKATSFKEFCTNYLLTPRVVPITRADYWALPTKDDRDTTKDGAFFTAGIFPETGVRLKAGIAYCSLVAIDVDNSDEARPLVAPGVISNLLPFNHFAYHTLSSTPEHPRIRVVVDVEVIPKEHYHRNVHYVADLLGLKTRNSETLDCSRPMYRPAVFMLPRTEPSSPAKFEDAPILSARLDGKPMTPAPAPRPGDNGDSGDDDLADIRDMRPRGREGPVPGLSTDAVKRMLSFLSPGLPREEWLNVCCGLKHQFQDDEETGFALFDEWSSGEGNNEKYKGEEATRYTWDSFKAMPEGNIKPKTILTVQWLAKSRGWEPLPDAEEALNALTEAIQDASSLTTLTTTLLKDIAREKALGDVERGILVSAVQARLRVLGHRIPLPTLKQEVARVRKEAAKEADTSMEVLPPWLSTWAFVASRHRMVRISSPEIGIKLEAFTVMVDAECEKDYPDPDMTPVKVISTHPAFPRADRQDYNPGRPHEGFYEEGPELVMNTYRASYPEADPTKSEEAGRIMKEHLGRMFPDPKLPRILLSFLAYMVQNPGAKITWAIYIQGVQGCGKSVIAGAQAAVLGSTNVTYVDRCKLDSSFNDWAYGSQLLVFDEILTGSDKKELMDKLKPVISELTVGVSRKFHDSGDAPNRTNSLFLSNHPDGIRIDDGERRYFVMKSAFQTKEQVAALPKGYFAELFSLTTSLAGGYRHFLLNYPLDPDFEPLGIAPWSADRAAVIQCSLNAVDIAIKDVIDEGNFPLIQADLISMTELKRAIGSGAGRSTSIKDLMSALLRMGFSPMGQVRLGEGRQNLWVHKDFSDFLDRSPAEVAKDRYTDSRFSDLPTT